MRIYFFDIETGIFQGEEYEYDEKARYLEGATTIAPPPYERGTVPVYKREDRCWTLERLWGREAATGATPADSPAARGVDLRTERGGELPP